MGIVRAARCRLASWIAPKALATVDVELRIDSTQVDEEVDRVCDKFQAALHRRQLERTKEPVQPVDDDEDERGEL